MADRDTDNFIKFTWHDAYIDFLANPAEPRTDSEWAKDMSMHRDTIYKWKKQHVKEIHLEADKRRKAYMGELRAKAYKALTKKMDKDTNAIKLAFQLLGDFVEKTESRIEYLTQEQKRTKARNLLQEILDKKAKPGLARPEGTDSKSSG